MKILYTKNKFLHNKEKHEWEQQKQNIVNWSKFRDTNKHGNEWCQEPSL